MGKEAIDGMAIHTGMEMLLVIESGEGEGGKTGQNEGPVDFLDTRSALHILFLFLSVCVRSINQYLNKIHLSSTSFRLLAHYPLHIILCTLSIS